MDIHDFETDRLPWDRHCEKTNIVLIGDGGYNSGAIGGGARLTDASQQSGVGSARIPLDRFAGIRPVKLSDQSTLKKPLENVATYHLRGFVHHQEDDNCVSSWSIHAALSLARFKSPSPNPRYPIHATLKAFAPYAVAQA